MAKPSTNLGQSFYNFWNDFNAVKNNGGDYSYIKQYLSGHVTMQRVDDADSVSGTPAFIVRYLNWTQAQTAYYPQFTPSTTIPAQNAANTVGFVTGLASYQDKDTSGTTIPVSFSFRFHPDASGDWLIVNASATPTAQISTWAELLSGVDE